MLSHQKKQRPQPNPSRERRMLTQIVRNCCRVNFNATSYPKLPRHRPLKHHRTRPPQRIALRMTMGMLHRMSIRMDALPIAVAEVTNVAVSIATGRSIRRRGLR